MITRETISPIRPWKASVFDQRTQHGRPKEYRMTEANLLTESHWTEHPDHALPLGLLDVGDGGNISIELTGLRVRMGARTYPDGPEEHFHAQLGDTLLEVFEKAAHALGKPLLPPAPAAPLDFFRMRRHDGTWSEPFTDLH